MMLSMIIFLEIFFLQIYSEDTFDCTGYDDDSFHPMYNSNNCRYYWHCIYVDSVYMKAVKRICPAGTEFDIRLNECEVSSLVNCVPIKSSDVPQTSKSTIKYSKLTRLTRLKVLSSTSTQLTRTFYLEQLLKNLIAMKHQSSMNITTTPFETTTTTEIPFATTTPPFLISKLKRRHLFHRYNLTLNILTSNEHKIRRFSINQTNGILIQCNQIRRRQLRDLIFRTTPSTIRLNSSSKIFHYDILSLTIFLIFTKISD